MAASWLYAQRPHRLQQGQRYAQPSHARTLPLRSLIAAFCVEVTLALPKVSRKANAITGPADRMHHLVGALWLLGNAAEKAVEAPTVQNSLVVMSHLPQQLEAASRAAETIEADAQKQTTQLSEAQALELKQASEISEQRTALIDLKAELVRQAERMAKIEQESTLEKSKLEDELQSVAATKLALSAQERAVEKASQLAIQRIRKDADHQISVADAESSQMQQKLDQVKAEAREELNFQTARNLKSLFEFIGPPPREAQAQATSIALDGNAGDASMSLRHMLAAEKSIGLATEYARSYDRMLDLESGNTKMKPGISAGDRRSGYSFRRLRSYLASSPHPGLSQHSSNIDTRHPQQHLVTMSMHDQGVAETQTKKLVKNEKENSDLAFAPLLRAQAILSALKLHPKGAVR